LSSLPVSAPRHLHLAQVQVMAVTREISINKSDSHREMTVTFAPKTPSGSFFIEKILFLLESTSPNTARSTRGKSCAEPTTGQPGIPLPHPSTSGAN
jgi:hypothetical protein